MVMVCTAARPPGFRHLLQLREVARPEALADRLEHFDGDDVVVLAAHVAVVGQREVGEVGEALLLRACPRPFQLRRRQRDAMHAAAELGGGDLGQPAPAAADFEDRVARLRVEHAPAGAGTSGSCACCSDCCGSVPNSADE
jgi:hypothetical protein